MSQPGSHSTSAELDIDIDNLYREEVYSDRGPARVRCLVPVTADGEADPSRARIFVGETSVLTQLGAIPLSFELAADTLAEAFATFPEGVDRAMAELNERARELARDEASRIVVPGTGGPGIPGGGGMPGPGGGIIMK